MDLLRIIAGGHTPRETEIGGARVAIKGEAVRTPSPEAVRNTQFQQILDQLKAIRALLEEIKNNTQRRW